MSVVSFPDNSAKRINDAGGEKKVDREETKEISERVPSENVRFSTFDDNSDYSPAKHIQGKVNEKNPLGELEDEKKFVPDYDESELDEDFEVLDGDEESNDTTVTQMSQVETPDINLTITKITQDSVEAKKLQASPLLPIDVQDKFVDEDFEDYPESPFVVIDEISGSDAEEETTELVLSPNDAQSPRKVSSPTLVDARSQMRDLYDEFTEKFRGKIDLTQDVRSSRIPEKLTERETQVVEEKSDETCAETSKKAPQNLSMGLDKELSENTDATVEKNSDEAHKNTSLDGDNCVANKREIDRAVTSKGTKRLNDNVPTNSSKKFKADFLKIAIKAAVTKKRKRTDDDDDDDDEDDSDDEEENRSNEKFGSPIPEEIAADWKSIIESGLEAETKNELSKKHLPASNCQILRPPALNPNTRHFVSRVFLRTDDRRVATINQLGTAMSAIGKVLARNVKDRQDEIDEDLKDAAKILADLIHSSILERRTSAFPGLGALVKEAATGSVVDSFLFDIDENDDEEIPRESTTSSKRRKTISEESQVDEEEASSSDESAIDFSEENTTQIHANQREVSTKVVCGTLDNKSLVSSPSNSTTSPITEIYEQVQEILENPEISADRSKQATIEETCRESEKNCAQKLIKNSVEKIRQEPGKNCAEEGTKNPIELDEIEIIEDTRDNNSTKISIDPRVLPKTSTIPKIQEIINQLRRRPVSPVKIPTKLLTKEIVAKSASAVKISPTVPTQKALPAFEDPEASIAVHRIGKSSGSFVDISSDSVPQHSDVQSTPTPQESSTGKKTIQDAYIRTYVKFISIF